LGIQVKPIIFKGGREKDLARQIRLVFSCLIIFFSIMTVRIFTGVQLSLLIHLTVSLVGGVAAALLAEKVGEAFGGRMYGLKPSAVSRREQLSADMDKIRFYQREGRFEEALRLANVVLDRDPDFPDALFLKAQILWRGFGNKKAAKASLEKVMRLVPSTETLHRWALNYYHELAETEKHLDN
jgi:tetratricopeptide (TPR) repeat protein